MKTAIVTTSSDKYFHLLLELIDSIKRFKKSSQITICLIKNNLSDENVNFLRKKYKIKNISPVIKFFKDLNVDPYDYAQLCLPKYFPKFNKYIWIDADAWLNSWDGIELLYMASQKNKFAISSMADRHTNFLIRIIWLVRNIGIVKSQNLKHSLKMSLPLKISRKIGLKPHLNFGVFALNKNSKFWKVLISNYKKLRGSLYGKNQLSMNLSVYQNLDMVNILPHYINCLPNHLNVIFDVKKKLFVEKYPPHNSIGVIHLAGGAVVRKGSKDFRFFNHKIKIKTLDGKYIWRSYRFKNP